MVEHRQLRLAGRGCHQFACKYIVAEVVADPLIFQQFGDFIAGEVLALAIKRNTTVAAGSTDIDGLEVGLDITAV